MNSRYTIYCQRRSSQYFFDLTVGGDDTVSVKANGDGLGQEFHFPADDLDAIIDALSQLREQATGKSTIVSDLRVIRIDPLFRRQGIAWGPEEDRLLTQEHANGTTLDAMVDIHQRAPSAIRSRLRKLACL